MVEPLYLDTARLGQMSPTASRMYADFGRLAAEVPTGRCTEKFLFHGAAAASSIAKRYPELRRWQGVGGLKQQLRTSFAANADASTEVLLTNRTMELMEFGVRSVLGRCNRILLTDLTWPPYLQWMLKFFGSRGIDVSILTLKHAIWQEQRTACEIAGMIQNRVRDDRCDGLFLPAVTHTGVRLPIADIFGDLSAGSSLPASVVDASQAYGHIDVNGWTHHADFTFGGMHKWVRAYLPLSVGFTNVQRRNSRLSCCKPVQPGERNETINFAPFMTACGALSDLRCVQTYESPVAHSSACPRLLNSLNGRLLQIDPRLRSRILLIRLQRRTSQSEIQQRLAAAGISATVFPDSTVRISRPMDDLEENKPAPNSPL